MRLTADSAESQIVVVTATLRVALGSKRRRRGPRRRRRPAGLALGALGCQFFGRPQVYGEAERFAGQTALVEAERQRQALSQPAGAHRRVTQVRVALGGPIARRQLADEDEREDARVARVLHGVGDELERQQAEVVHRQARSIERVDGHADAADGHVESDQRQIFAAFQTSEIIHERVDRLARVLDAPQSSTRLATDVLGYELLRQSVDLSVIHSVANFITTMLTVLLHCALSSAAQCIVISPVCLHRTGGRAACVCVFVGLLP